MSNGKEQGDQHKTKKKEIFSKDQVSGIEQRGNPIPFPHKHLLEAQFGQDLSNVRVHNGPEAAKMTSLLNARAFSLGNHIFFAPGEYNPNSAGGQKMLAHEVAHVLQQANGTKKNNE